MSKKLTNAIADMREGEALKLAQKMVDDGSDPMAILAAAREAMDIVGQRYEKGDYFLPELMLAGEMLTQITELVKPALAKMPEVESHGKVIIGTVEGDIHDIGKNIVASLLRAAGFKVTDLGKDVPLQEFIEAARREDADIVGVSALLTTTMQKQRELIAKLKEAGIRGRIKVMIGGAPSNEEWAKEIGADGYAPDATEAVKLARKLTATRQKTGR